MIGGKYRVERALGAGAMGAVFEVSHRVTGKRFAVKWLMPELIALEDSVKRFIREAQVAGRFEHPNAVQIYDIGQDASSFYIVMELLDGESLADRLQRAGRMTPAEACALLLPCLSAVAAAHAAGVIHRDLKPGNIFVCRPTPDRGEHVKVLDFGISKLSTEGGAFDATMTRPGTVLGTPQYMSPEQMRGERVDVRTDVYALGVILYEMLSGVRPFAAQTFADLVLRVLTEIPPPLDRAAAGVSPELAGVVACAMARDPAQRFESIEAMIRALQPFREPIADTPVRVAAGPQTAAAEPGPPSESLRAVERPSLPPPRASRAFYVLGGAALGLSLVGLMATLRDAPAELPASEVSAAAAAPAPAVAATIAPAIAEPPIAADAGTLSPPEAPPARVVAAPAPKRRPARVKAKTPEAVDQDLRDDELIDPFQ